MSKLEEVSDEMLVFLRPRVSSRVSGFPVASPCLWGKLHTPHSTLYTPHSTLYTPHSTLYTVHSTLYTLHSTLYILHSIIYTLHSSLHTPHSTLYTPHSTLYTLHSTLYTLHSTLRTLHFTHSTLHTLHSTLHTLHSNSTLHTVHFTLYTWLFSDLSWRSFPKIPRPLKLQFWLGDSSRDCFCGTLASSMYFFPIKGRASNPIFHWYWTSPIETMVV